VANYLTLPTTTSKGRIRVVVETPRGAEAKLTYKPKKKHFEYTRPLPAAWPTRTTGAFCLLHWATMAMPSTV
jgi:inorganic pyrophosphatase